MIEYYKGAFNLNLLLIVSGSAVYRAMIPGLISVAFSLWLNTPGFDNVATREPLGHPQAIGTLLGSITLIIVFKANQAYSRNYEAYTTVFAMSSRFQDSVQHMMVYHMQCDHYKEMRPPSYFDHPELNGLFLTRDRERFRPDMSQEVRLARSIRKSINYVNDAKKQRRSESWDSFEEGVLSVESERGDMLGEPDRLMYRERLDGGWGRLFPDKKTLRPTTTYYDPMRADDLPKEGFASHRGGRTPALYLQELVHLASLLNAVALSTLRNDIDGAESPLDVADLGGTWPEVDPGKIKNIRGSYWDRLIKVVGADVTEAARTKYNASRPLEVVGGVSAAEIKFLQMARGPYAKTVLAFNWLSEFMVREHKSGSTGTIGDALISRSMQFLGNGMSQYNQARKIMIVPFPVSKLSVNMHAPPRVLTPMPFTTPVPTCPARGLLRLGHRPWGTPTDGSVHECNMVGCCIIVFRCKLPLRPSRGFSRAGEPISKAPK